MGVKEIIKEKVEKRFRLILEIKKIIIEKLNLNMRPEEIEDDAPLFGAGLGLDSIDALELAAGVEENYGVSISDAQLEVFRSVNTLTDHIQSQLGVPQ